MSDESIQEKLEKVRQSYIASLDEKRKTIARDWASLKENWDEDTYENMYMVIHGIAGSAETFGFPELTQQARNVIDQLKKTNSTRPDTSLENNIDREILGILAIIKKFSKS